jgi:glycosyltransferase involved in cell wall biosynthesis
MGRMFKKLKLKKIVNITSAHSRYDTRIYHKICKSLSKYYSVTLICADGKGSVLNKKISIVDLGSFKNRTVRFLSFLKIFKKALKIDGDLYHLHDPDLILVGLLLIAKGKKVIFDSHEDVELDILDKNYLPLILRKIISKIYNIFEKFSLQKFNGIIAATPHICRKLIKINRYTININNFPIIKKRKFTNNKNKINIKKNQICYVGSISKVRGILELVRSLELTRNNVTLNLAGNFNSKYLEEHVKSQPGWKRVNYLGFVKNEILFSKFHNICGVVNFLNIYNHQESLPTKLFEYMQHKLPVIMSNIKSFKKINSKYHFGLVCDPTNPKDIANKIDYLIENKSKVIKMGKNGYKAVLKEFNWQLEEKKLLLFYKRILLS